MKRHYLTLILVLLSALVSINAQDTSPPIFSDLTLSSYKYSRGEEIEFLVEAFDFGSGIGSISIEIKSEKDISKTLLVEGDIDPSGWKNISGDTYSNKLLLNNKVLPGIWFISEIKIVDNNFNEFYDYYFYDSPNVQKFEILKEVIDNENPELIGVSSDQAEYFAGDKVEIALQASDRISDVRHIRAYFYPNDGSGIGISVDGEIGIDKWFKSTRDDITFFANIDLGTKLGDAEWYLYSLALQDEYGNEFRQIYEIDESPIKFNVIDTSPDIHAPELVSFDFDAEKYEDGDKLQFRLEANDNRSKIKNIKVEIAGPEGKQTHDTFKFIGSDKPSSFDGNRGKDVYVGEFKLSSRLLNGTWFVSKIEMSDNAGNISEMRFDVNSSPDTFDVDSDLRFYSFPSLAKVTAAKSTYVAGEEVTLNMFFNYNPELVKVVIAHENGEYQISYGWPTDLVWDGSDRYFEALFDLDEHILAGKWYVSEVFFKNDDHHVFDETYTIADSPFVFDITNDTADTVAPILKDVEVDKDIYEAGEDITVEVVTGKEMSGMASISVEITSSDQKQKYDLSGRVGVFGREWKLKEGTIYTPTTDYYTLTFSLNRFAIGTEWYVSKVTMVDNVGNKFEEEYEFYTFESPEEFEITNNPDFEKPTFKGISSNQLDYAIGEDATINVEALDNLSGIKAITVGFKNTENKTFFLEGDVDSPLGWIDSGNKSYYKSMNVKEPLVIGNWFVHKLLISDEENNVLVNDFSEDNTPLQFEVLEERLNITNLEVSSSEDVVLLITEGNILKVKSKSIIDDIQVYDIAGRSLKLLKLNDTEYRFESFPGIYILKLKVYDSSLTKKIILN